LRQPRICMIALPDSGLPRMLGMGQNAVPPISWTPD
jgi:hypothetical protein